MNATRQPASPTHGTTSRPITAAMIQPQAQKLSRMTSILPRLRAGATSLTSVDATGSSPPRPSPTTKRKTSSDISPQARPLSSVAML